MLPIATPVPPDNTVVIVVPLGYSVIVAREPVEDPMIVHLSIDPTQTVVINGTAVPAQRKG